MGKIAKAYRTIIRDGSVIEASDAIRAFDDLYDEFNGNLDSQNIVMNVPVDSSKVSFDHTAFSATQLQAAITELIDRGYSDLHFLGDASRGISVFPGTVEVNGVYCRVNSRIDITRSDITLITDESPAGDTLYGISVPAVQVLTASDFKVIAISDISSTSGLMDLDKRGIYATSEAFGTASRRVIASTIYDPNNLRFSDAQLLSAPNRGQIYEMTLTEKSGLGAIQIAESGCSVQNFRTTSIFRYYNFETYDYHYLFSGFTGTASGAPLFLTSGLNNRYSEWRINYFKVSDETQNSGWQDLEWVNQGATANLLTELSIDGFNSVFWRFINPAYRNRRFTMDLRRKKFKDRVIS